MGFNVWPFADSRETSIHDGFLRRRDLRGSAPLCEIAKTRAKFGCFLRVVRGIRLVP